MPPSPRLRGEGRGEGPSRDHADHPRWRQALAGGGAVNCARSAKLRVCSISAICLTASSKPSLPKVWCSTSSNSSPISPSCRSETPRILIGDFAATNVLSTSGRRGLANSAIIASFLGSEPHHPHPKHCLVADIDIVFANKIELAVAIYPEHREAGRHNTDRGPLTDR